MILKRKNILIFLLIFLALGVLIFSIFSTRQKQNSVWKFVPADIVFYFSTGQQEQNLWKNGLWKVLFNEQKKENLLQKWLRLDLKRKDIFSFIFQFDELDFLKTPEQKNQFLNLWQKDFTLTGLEKTGDIHLVLFFPQKDLFKNKEILEKIGFIFLAEQSYLNNSYKIFSFKNSEKDTQLYLLEENDWFALTFNQFALEKLISVKSGKWRSWQEKNKSTFSLNQAENQSIFQAYLNRDFLLNRLNQEKRGIGTDFLIRYLKAQKSNEEIFIEAQSRGDDLLLSVKNQKNTSIFSPSNLEIKNEEKITAFISNTKDKLNMAFYGNNFNQYSAEIKNILQGFYAGFDNFLAAEKNNFENYYSLDLKNDLEPILANNFSFFIWNNLPVEQNKNWPLSFPLNFGIFKKSKFLLITETDKTAGNKIEKITQQILTQELPDEKLMLLPDGSKVINLFSHPAKFVFLEQNLSGFKVKFFKEPITNFEIAYAFVKNKLLISNSLSLLNNILKQIQNNTLSLEFPSHLEAKESLVYFPFKQKVGEQFGLTGFWLKDQSNGQDLNLNILLK